MKKVICDWCKEEIKKNDVCYCLELNNESFDICSKCKVAIGRTLNEKVIIDIKNQFESAKTICNAKDCKEW